MPPPKDKPEQTVVHDAANTAAAINLTTKDKSRPSYCKTALDAASHLAYVLGHFRPEVQRKIMDLVASEIPPLEAKS